VGTYNIQPGLWYCSICPAGYYSSEDGTQCNICPAGTYSYYGTRCFPCGTNRYSTQPGSNLCTTCPTGLISNENHTGCIECPPGTHVDSMEGCVQCSMGYVANKSGAAVCTQCPLGTYSDPTYTYCIPCPVGYYSYVPTNLCSRCPSSKFGNETGLTDCYTCPEGTFTSISGTTCDQCVVGTYKNIYMIGCFYCGSGYYSTIAGATSCKLCGSGRYSDLSHTVCYDCPPGTFSNHPTDVCYICESGFYNSLTGQTACLGCEVGTYSISSHTGCLTCAAGTYSTGFTNECSLCETGTYSTGVGVTYCTQCPIGQSTNISGSGITTCMDCPVNTYNYDPGATCMACELGEYTTSSGTTTMSLITQCGPRPSTTIIYNVTSDWRTRICELTSYSWGIRIWTNAMHPVKFILTSPQFCSLYLQGNLSVYAQSWPTTDLRWLSQYTLNDPDCKCVPDTVQTQCPITLTCTLFGIYYILIDNHPIYNNRSEIPSKPQMLVDFIGTRTQTSFSLIVRFYQPPSTGYPAAVVFKFKETLPQYVTLDRSDIETKFVPYMYYYAESVRIHSFLFMSYNDPSNKNFYSNSSNYTDIIRLKFKINSFIDKSGVFKVIDFFNSDIAFDRVVVNNHLEIKSFKELPFVRGDNYDPDYGGLYLELYRTINPFDLGIVAFYKAWWARPCQPCPAGTYRNNHSWTTCMPCSICPDGTYHSKLCTVYADTGECSLPLTNCGANQYISTPYVKGSPGVLGSQAICSECSCPAGYFIESGCDDGVTAPVCRQCSTCYSKTFRACTLWTNTICEDLAQCRAVDKRVTYQWLIDNPNIRCEIGYHIINISGTTPICEKCPDYLLGLDGMKCSMCPGYRKPYWDGSICVCKTPTVQMTSGECMCDVGYELGLSGCAPCLNNTYSDVSIVLTDNHWDQLKLCLPCPSGTYANTQQSTCTACPHYQYRTQNDTSCKNCAAGYYSSDPTVSTCTACTTSCSLGYYSMPCPTDHSKYICQACKPLPPNAQFLPMTIYATSYQCIWECNAGYYRGIDECKLCSTDIFCVPGKIIEPCSEIQDLTCTQDCVNATKPMFNSEWDYGCNWRCSDGYVMTVTDFIMYVEYDCVLPGSYDPYQF
jgi:hypothetical protein